jgi:hypothetical protein
MERKVLKSNIYYINKIKYLKKSEKIRKKKKLPIDFLKQMVYNLCEEST